MRKRLIWIPAVALALFTGSSASAAEDARFIPAKRPTKAAASPSPAAAAPRAEVRVISMPLEECPADDNEAMTAVKAFLDPATGELRAPTPEEEAALARAIGPKSRRAEAARTPMALPNGLVAIELGEDSMMDVVVRTGADGKPVFSCTPRSETPKALTRPLPAPKADAGNEEK